MDYTTRLGLNKPDPDPQTGDFLEVQKLNDNADKIDSTISFTICNSTARPAVPFSGQAILELDTGRAYIWGGSAWIPLLIGAKGRLDTSLGIGTDPDANSARRLKILQSGTNGSLSNVLIEQTGAAAGSRALSLKAGGEANERWWIDYDGKMQWGPGTAGGDVSLARSASGVLDVTGKLTVGGKEPASVTRQIFTASGTWTKPAGAKTVWVRAVGGGGGGGGASASVAGAHSKGGGGGGGEYAERWFTGAELGATETVTIGAAGVGGNGGGGGSGGVTSFGSWFSCNGGGGGNMNTSNSASWGQSGGLGGTGGTGTADFRSGGQGGALGWGDGALAGGGSGGSSVLGGGGRSSSSGGTVASSAGDDAKGYGGGGGGALVNTTGATTTGGDGKAGVVIVTVFF